MPERPALPRPFAPRSSNNCSRDGPSEQPVKLSNWCTDCKNHESGSHRAAGKNGSWKVHQRPHIEKRENRAIGQLLRGGQLLVQRDEHQPIYYRQTEFTQKYAVFFNQNSAFNILPQAHKCKDQLENRPSRSPPLGYHGDSHYFRTSIHAFQVVASGHAEDIHAPSAATVSPASCAR